MAVTRIQFQSSCPFGHKEIDFVDLGHRKYIFCYRCNKQFIQEDFEA